MTDNPPWPCEKCGGPSDWSGCAACQQANEAVHLADSSCWICGRSKSPGATCC